MEDQNESEADKSPIIRPNKAIIPTVIIPKAQSIITSNVPFIKRRWVKWTAVCFVVATIVALLANLTSIPNNVMGWYLNWKAIHGGGDTISAWQPPELPPGCKMVYASYGNIHRVESIAELENNNMVALTMSGKGPLGFYIKNHRFWYTLDYQTDWGVINIRENHITNQSAMPEGWDMNSSSNALEIVDEGFNPILQIYYKHPQEIVVLGQIKSSGIIYSIGYNMFMQYGHAPMSLNLQKVFKYPSFNHQGQYDENWTPERPWGRNQAMGAAWSLILNKSVAVTDSNIVVDGVTNPFPKSPFIKPSQNTK